MTRLRVDLPALAELVLRMDRFAAQLAAAHSDVERRVAWLSAGWAGEAAQTQAAAQAEWSAGAAGARQALGELTSIVATAHANYAAAVEANRRMWAQ